MSCTPECNSATWPWYRARSKKRTFLGTQLHPFLDPPRNPSCTGPLPESSCSCIDLPDLVRYQSHARAPTTPHPSTLLPPHSHILRRTWRDTALPAHAVVQTRLPGVAETAEERRSVGAGATTEEVLDVGAGRVTSCLTFRRLPPMPLYTSRSLSPTPLSNSHPWIPQPPYPPLHRKSCCDLQRGARLTWADCLSLSLSVFTTTPLTIPPMPPCP